MENNESKRKLFANDEKFEVISFEELKRTVNAKDLGGLPKTRPVAHFQFIQDLCDILTENNILFEVDHIYVGKSTGNKHLPMIENMHGGVENILESWILDRLTGLIKLPTFGTNEMDTCIAFSYHERGLDIAFGHMGNMLIEYFVEVEDREFENDIPDIKEEDAMDEAKEIAEEMDGTMPIEDENDTKDNVEPKKEV